MTTGKRAPKIAVIGAGSFVFSLGLLYDLIVEYRLQGSELALMDVNEEMAETMARIARRMADDVGVTMTIHGTADREAALRGADFVTSSVAVEIRKRWEMDKAVMHRHGIHEIYSECGGVGGLSYTLRSLPLVLGIVRDMERLCPQAWLLNTTNPLPRLLTAILRHTAIRAVGFCNAAWGGQGGYKIVEVLLNRDMRDLDVVSAGLNHFAWLLTAKDRWTGEDLMPATHARLAQGVTTADHYAFGPLTMKYWQRYGWLPLAGDTHTGEFLPFDTEIGWECPSAHHGDDKERAARRQVIIDTGAGKYPWQSLLMHGRSWEHPADFIDAMVHGTRRRLDAVNILNHGAIDGLPDDAVVEVPAVVENGEIRGERIGALPEPIATLCAEVSAAHQAVAEAAYTGDRALVEEAVRIDPAITEKAAAVKALQELIDVHADQLPQFHSASIA